MEKRYITDSDFVPNDYLEYHKNDSENSLISDYYQILYGILREGMTLNYVYDLVMRMSKREKVDVVKRFKLTAWKKTTEAIIRTLQKLNMKDCKVIVHIPFTNYEQDITATITSLQLAAFSIEEILTKGDGEIEISDSPRYEFPVKNMKELMIIYFKKYQEDLMDRGNTVQWKTDEEGKKKRIDEREYWWDILGDEMYRRGIRSFNNTNAIRPSRYFSEPYRYKEAFIEKGKDLDTKDIEKGTEEEPTKPFEQIKTKEKVAVMYYILQEIAPTTNDNQHEVIALLNYAIDGRKYNIQAPKKETNNNTIKRYVSNLRSSALKEEKQDFVDSVKARLAEYGLKLPEDAV